jgi:RNA polymerase sigma factor for flagellar operon FliA
MQETDGLTYKMSAEGHAGADKQVVVVGTRDQTIEGHMWLVRCIAKSMADSLPQQVDVDDLISAGTVGLIKAVDDFDPARGAKLETYARYRIKGAILDELRKQDMLPYSTRSKLRCLDRAIHNLERTLGRYPTDREIIEEAGISEDEMSRLLAVATAIDLYSLDDIIENGDGQLQVARDHPDAQSEDPLSKLEREEMARVMVEGLKSLPQMERTVLGLYYYEGLRMKDIGEVLGVSESRISQVHSKAILLLRARLRIHLWG